VGNTALIAGATGGIGRAVVQRLTADGWTVVAAVRDAAKLEAAALPPYVGDLTDPANCRAAVEHAMRVAGRLDALVNCVGASKPIDLLSLSAEDWGRFRSLNLDLAFFLSQAAARAMVAQGEGGAIIHFGSLSAHSGGANAAYAAAKAGIEGLTRHLARALAARGITVNAILPGTTDTGMVRGAFPAEVLAAFAKASPLGRLGRPEEVAHLVAMLLAPAGRYVTGAILPVTGGADLPGALSIPLASGDTQP
jgi:NAD(P)-dependent dehydrogenase (short-subunit alcohol dehydrogenase family)